MGTPVTARMDSAAPPRASPSIWVRISPVRPTCSLNCWATLTASCPVMAFGHQQHLVGWTASLDLAPARPSALVDLQAASGVDDDPV